MSTQFTNRQWRLPNNENKDKQSNYSMDFDGSSQYIELNTSLNGLSSITYSCWVKASSFKNWSYIISAGNYASGERLFGILLDVNGSFQAYGGYSSGAVLDSNVDLTSNTWYHLAVVYTNNQDVAFYVNGVAGSTGSFTNTNLIAASSPTRIGSYTGSVANLFDGQIDGVSIFNYALSSSQVTTLYGSSSTGIGNPMSLSPKPVAYYPLGDQDAFNGADYLVPNSSLKDYVFDFDGSNAQSVNCGNDNSLQATTALTLSAWIKYTTDDTNFRYVLTRRDLNETNYMLYLNNTTGSKTLKFGSNGTATSSGSVTYNQWHHVAVTVNGTNVSFYIDGQPAGTSTITGINSFADKDFIIGDVTYSTTYEFAGLISNPKMFNTALSSTEVETLYNNGSPLTSMSGFTSLQGWWKLDASDTYDSSTGNWTIEDHAGSNDGTSSGMTQANLVQSDLSFTSGYSPYALDFDGTNDKINLNSTVNLSNSWSVGFWFKTPATTSNNMTVFRGNSTNNEGEWSFFRYFSVSYLASGRFSTRLTSGGTSSFVALTPNVLDNLWHNLTITYNYSASEYKVYLDGNVCFSGVYDTSTGNTFNEIGTSEPSWYWLGQLSNISIWNAALTSSQATEIYNEGIPQNLNNHSAVSSLVSWWQLGSNSSFNTNWTVLDEKGSNNGTSSNMTEDDIVDGVNTYGGGTSSGMGGDEVIGDAPYSTANSLSVNMDVLDRVTDTPS